MKVSACMLALALTGSASADLVNGGFEDFPTFGYSFWSGTSPTTGWATTAQDNLLEIWGDGFMGVPAYEGGSFAELNANYASTLYQDVNGLGDFNQVNWHFAHRGRYGLDTMRLTITDMGTDQMYGGGDDTVLFTGDFSADDSAWQFHTGTVTSIGNLTRFAFEAVDAVGGTTQGNLIDFCGFGAGAIPGPGAVSLLGVATFLVSFGRSRR